MVGRKGATNKARNELSEAFSVRVQGDKPAPFFRGGARINAFNRRRDFAAVLYKLPQHDPVSVNRGQ